VCGPKSTAEMAHPPCSPDLNLNDLWPFPKIKSAEKDKDFRILKTSKKEKM
jgi:hypothetical protein